MSQLHIGGEPITDLYSQALTQGLVIEGRRQTRIDQITAMRQRGIIPAAVKTREDSGANPLTPSSPDKPNGGCNRMMGILHFLSVELPRKINNATNEK